MKLNRLFFLSLCFCVCACESPTDSTGMGSGPATLPQATPSPASTITPESTPRTAGASVPAPPQPVVIPVPVEPTPEQDIAALESGLIQEQTAVLRSSRLDRLLRLPNFPVESLSPAQISSLTDNQKGILVDHHTEDLSCLRIHHLAFEGNHPQFEEPLFHRYHAPAGYCAMHAFNHAMGREFLSNDEFVTFVNQLYREHPVLWGERFDANHGVDLQILRNLLDRMGVLLRNAHQHPPTIGELPGFAEDKTAAIQAYIGQAQWLIVAVIREVPCPSYSPWRTTLQAGHYVAMRKDRANQWWLLDSISVPAVNIPLAVLHHSLVLLVPTQD